MSSIQLHAENAFSNLYGWADRSVSKNCIISWFVFPLYCHSKPNLKSSSPLSLFTSANSLAVVSV
jgi:hypothetical protein